MSRRSQAPKRVVLPDPKYGNKMLATFMNMIMFSGKKSVAEQIVYGALERSSDRTGRDGSNAWELLGQALDNVKPSVEVKSRRVGGATYQVPVEVKTKRSQTLALRWLLTAARKRKNKTMSDKLSNELMEASQNKGAAIKKREDTHRMAESNKAFAHYRW